MVACRAITCCLSPTPPSYVDTLGPRWRRETDSGFERGRGRGGTSSVRDDASEADTDAEGSKTIKKQETRRFTRRSQSGGDQYKSEQQYVVVGKPGKQKRIFPPRPTFRLACINI